MTPSARRRSALCRSGTTEVSMRVKRAFIVAGTSGALILAGAVAPGVVSASETGHPYSGSYSYDHWKGDNAEKAAAEKAAAEKAAAEKAAAEKAAGQKAAAEKAA